MSFLLVSDEELEHRGKQTSQRVRSHLKHQKDGRPRDSVSECDSRHGWTRNKISLVEEKVAGPERVHRAEQDEIGLALDRLEQQREAGGDAAHQLDQRGTSPAELVHDAHGAIAHANVEGQEQSALDDRRGHALEGLDGMLDQAVRRLGERRDDFQRPVERKRNPQKVPNDVVDVGRRARVVLRVEDSAVLVAGKALRARLGV